MLEQLPLVALELLLKLLECGAAVAGVALTGRALLDVPGQVKEILFSGPEWVVRDTVNPGIQRVKLKM